MQKCLIFLLVIWSTSPFAPGNTTNHLQFYEGCRAVLRCQHDREDSPPFTWFYKKTEESKEIRISFRDDSGFIRYKNRTRIKALNNMSLVINDLKDEDQGLYWCRVHLPDKSLENKPTTFVIVIKDNRKETQETVFIAEGRSFTYACPSKFANAKWTFKASNTSLVQEQHTYAGTFNNILKILNIKRADAGKYTCWITGCDGHMKKRHTVNVCVVTVLEREDSSVSCAVTCDVEPSLNIPNNTSSVNTTTWTLSVLVAPDGSLNCSIKLMPDGSSEVNNTNSTANALNNTNADFIPVVCGTSAALACLILMALLIWRVRPRLQEELSPVQLCCSGFCYKVEDETSVTYASVEIRSSSNTRNYPLTDEDCVYSCIKV